MSKVNCRKCGKEISDKNKFGICRGCKPKRNVPCRICKKPTTVINQTCRECQRKNLGYGSKQPLAYHKNYKRKKI